MSEGLTNDPQAALGISAQSIETEMRAMQRQRLNTLPTDAAMWLALVPIWTRSLAKRCGFLANSDGTESSSLDGFLDKAQSLGFCERKIEGSKDLAEWYRLQVFTALSSHLPEEFWPSAIDALLSSENEQTLALTFSQMIVAAPPKLAEKLLDKVPEIVVKIRTPVYRAQLMVSAASLRFLSDAPRRQFVLQALDAIKSISEANQRAELLARLASLMLDSEKLEQMDSVLKALQPVGTESGRVLIILASTLPQKLVPRAISLAQMLRDPSSRVNALASLAPRMMDEGIELLDDALNIISTIDNGRFREQALVNTAYAMMRLGYVGRAVLTTLNVTNDLTRTNVLGKLVAMIEDPRFREVLSRIALRGLDESDDTSIETAQIASRRVGLALTLIQVGQQDDAGKLIDDTLRLLEARGVSPAAENIDLFASLITVQQRLDRNEEADLLCQQAYHAAQEIEDPRDKCQALLRVARQVSDVQRRKLLREAHAATQGIADTATRVRELINVIANLDPDMWSPTILEALQLCETLKEQDFFWMPERVRGTVLQYLGSPSKRRLQSTASLIATKILESTSVSESFSAPEDHLIAPPAVMRWAQLASRTSASEAAKWFDGQILRLLSAGDTTQALAWLNTGDSLVPVLGAEIENAVMHGRQRVELLYRQQQDEKHLKYFLERQPQIDAYEALLNQEPNVWKQHEEFAKYTEYSWQGVVSDEDAGQGPDSIWALHYIGWAGVGKTMLMRYISSRLLTRHPVLMCRVDFDYLSPDFPVLKPGQLLLQLAADLQVRVGAQAEASVDYDSRFVQFRNSVERLHEALRTATYPAGELNNVRSTEFQSVLAEFAAILRSMPFPVVMVLDTCEELLKLQPAKGRLFSVEATFEILEQIHKLAPSTRVIFAGRQPLAQAGGDWEIMQDQFGLAMPLLPERKSYLAMYNIRGFDKNDAHDYLTLKRRLSISSDLEQTILTNSKDKGKPPPVKWTPERLEEPEQLYNPFKLNLYANWVTEDPALRVDVIGSGSIDPYIRLRVVGRITDRTMTKVLPYLVLLRRFDEMMLRGVLEVLGQGDSQQASNLFRQFAGVEWIDYIPTDHTTYLEINRNLYDDLLNYLEAEDKLTPAQGAEVAAMLRAKVLELVDDKTEHVAGLRFELLDAALRLMPQDEAARLWDKVAQHIVEIGNWNWVRNITSLLLTEGTLRDVKHRAWPAVWALYIARQMHAEDKFDPSDAWTEVYEAATTHPDPVMTEWLRIRAVAGRVAALRTASADITEVSTRLARLRGKLEAWDAEYPAGMPDFSDYQSEQLGASLCAAMEAVVERRELGGPDVAAQVAMLHKYLAHLNISSELQMFADTLLARIEACASSWDRAVALMRKALGTLESTKPHPYPQPQCWADWQAPTCLASRIRLEVFHIFPPQIHAEVKLLDRDVVETWQRQGANRLEDIDSERLVSAILQWTLADRLISLDTLVELDKADKYLSTRVPTRNAHRSVPPLNSSIASAMQAVGDFESAQHSLKNRLSEATLKRDEVSVREAQRTLVLLYRRDRTPEANVALFGSLAADNQITYAALVWPLLALTSVPGLKIPASPPSDTPRLHAWWRCQDISHLQASLSLITEVKLVFSSRLQEYEQPVDRNTGFEQLSLVLDAEEAAIVLTGAAKQVGTLVNVLEWLEQHPWQYEEAARLMLRLFALRDHALQDSQPLPLVPLLGARRMGALALDEGELLALRAPELAVPLLRLAYYYFEEAGDSHGATQGSILEALTLARENQRSEAAQVLTKNVRHSYEDFVRSSARIPGMENLPRWEVLLNLRGVVTSESIPVLRFTPWQGWLHRLLFAIIWSGPRLNLTQSRRALRVRFGAFYGRFVPTELQGPFPRVPRNPLAVRALEVLRSILWVWLLIALLAGLGVGANLLTERVVNFLVPGGIGDWIILASSAVGAALAGGIWLIISSRLGWYNHLLGKVTQPRLSIVSIQTENAAAPETQGYEMSLGHETTITVQFSLRQRHLWLFRARWPFLLPLVISVTMPDKQPVEVLLAGSYKQLAQRLTTTIGPLVSQMLEYASRHTLPIPMIVDLQTARLPWEAVFSLLSDPAPSLNTLRFSRVTQGRQGVRLPPRSWKEGHIALACNSNWQLLAERGWAAVTAPVVNVVETSQPQVEVSTAYSSEPVKVYHIMGTPQPSSGGYRLQVGASYSAEAALKSASNSSDTEETAYTLMSPDDPIARQAHLVVVQAEPTTGTSETSVTDSRLESERVTASYLRTFACELSSSGARAVLVLPQMESELAERVLTVIAEQLEGDLPPDQAMLSKVVRDVQQVIVSWGPVVDAVTDYLPLEPNANSPEPTASRTDTQQDQPASERQIEMAFDVCLFSDMAVFP